jgi:hypothetical protein
VEKQTAFLLRKRANEVAEMFSNKARGGNPAGETFTIAQIRPLSDLTACVVFDKVPGGKKAVAWFYFINSKKKPRWEYFFVSYSHLIGLERVKFILEGIEIHNYELNFTEESESE